MEGMREGAYEGVSAEAHQKLDERVENIRTRAEEHFNKHKGDWIAKEAKRLFERHKGQLRPTISPKGVLQTETTPSALAQRAYDNVTMRYEQRITRIQEAGESLKKKLRNTIRNNMDM
jgi:hypothetical protein